MNPDSAFNISLGLEPDTQNFDYTTGTILSYTGSMMRFESFIREAFPTAEIRIYHREPTFSAGSIVLDTMFGPVKIGNFTYHHTAWDGRTLNAPAA